MMEILWLVQYVSMLFLEFEMPKSAEQFPNEAAASSMPRFWDDYFACCWSWLKLFQDNCVYSPLFISFDWIGPPILRKLVVKAWEYMEKKAVGSWRGHFRCTRTLEWGESVVFRLDTFGSRFKATSTFTAEWSNSVLWRLWPSMAFWWMAEKMKDQEKSVCSLSFFP